MLRVGSSCFVEGILSSCFPGDVVRASVAMLSSYGSVLLIEDDYRTVFIINIFYSHLEEE